MKFWELVKKIACNLIIGEQREFVINLVIYVDDDPESPYVFNYLVDTKGRLDLIDWSTENHAIKDKNVNGFIIRPDEDYQTEFWLFAW
jgi:hypothetical protein